MTEQYGAPITGAQMKLLRAAGLPDGTEYQFLCPLGWANSIVISTSKHVYDDYRLPANHAAYTLLENGWLDGRNVALWFGGDKAPDDWDGGVCLLRNGNDEGYASKECLSWHDDSDEYDIIAYTRKADAKVDAAADNQDAVGSFLHRSGWEGNRDVELALQLFVEDYVTIAKMTPSEVKSKFDKGVQPLVVLHRLGLTKPEPTRLERFWRSKCREGELWEDIIKEALEFERD